ncbi:MULTISPECIES: glycosyltransferase [Pectobacterium]|uniref:glycosyltransferase n=1 Tax=Pectobacterium TaxID=122277 RepID=UPI0018DACAC0|nr:MULTISPECIES: glycosyltransferase [Pectobacterium]QPI41857.1 glycosyltransferase [Pectobacterium aroidearum]
MKRVLYVCPEFPVNPDSGGKKVFFKNLASLVNSDYISHLDCVFIDVDLKSTIDDFPLHIKCNGRFFLFERHGKKAEQLTLVEKLFSFVRYVFNSNPRFVHVRNNPKAKDEIKELIEKNNYDVIISDHLASYALVKNYADSVTHISHNIESDIFVDRFKYAKGIERYFSLMELFKTKRLERKIYGQFKDIYFLSDFDKMKAEDIFGLNNTKLGSFVIPFHDIGIDISQNKKNIVFIGGEGYFPNKEAIEWVCNELAPLTHDISYQIIGGNNNLSNKYKHVSNVHFLGFLSEELLTETVRNARLMISPVIFGSGIKIKVVEALSYGLPCFCTIESMKGIEIRDGCKPFDRNRPIAEIADELEALINNSTELKKMSSSIVDFYAENKRNLITDIIKDS